ncbi:MAG: lytic transglycosylase domain-containing protein [Bryobacteraceae bacterium]
MRKIAALFLLLGVCLSAVEPPLKILVLKNGQRMVYDEIVREGGTLFVRTGAQSVIIEAGEVAPAPLVKVPNDAPPVNVPGPAARLIGPNAGKHNLRPELIQAVMEVESGFQVNARSRVGAIGLMQLMPQTAKQLKVDAHDPEQNVEGGARLLDTLVKKYEGRRNGLSLALAAYNAGPGAVDRFGGIPPYKETRQYVGRVIRRFKELVRE